MSKILGDKKEFAIQYSFDSCVDGLLYGHMCYWINNTMIGKYDYLTIISDALVYLPEIISNSGKRNNKYFFEMDEKNYYTY